MRIRVNAAELKRVFQDIKPLYKNTQGSALIGFELVDHILHVTCINGVVYEQQLVSEHPGPYSLTVLYQDLSELLPGRGVVSLDLAPLYVEVASENMSAILHQANGMVSRYKRRCADFTAVPPGVFKHWARVFAETSPVAKSLQREAPVTFKPPYAVMKFPSFWLQLPNNILDTVMSLRDLKTVAEFAPEEIASSEDTIEFRRGAALLALPRNPLEDCKFIADLVGDHGTPSRMEGGARLPKVQQFLRSVGPGTCRCCFYKQGVELVVSRPKAQSTLRVGECTEKITAISTFLEYVQMFFKLCGEAPITITEGKSSICLQGPELSMLLTII